MKVKNFVKKVGSAVRYQWNRLQYLCLTGVLMAIAMLVPQNAKAQGGDYDSGIGAFDDVNAGIARYIVKVSDLSYIIAGIVGLIGALIIFWKFSNDEQDLRKSIMYLVGGCIGFIALMKFIVAVFNLESVTEAGN